MVLSLRLHKYFTGQYKHIRLWCCSHFFLFSLCFSFMNDCTGSICNLFYTIWLCIHYGAFFKVAGTFYGMIQTD